jgi:EcoEI R protein C-terminal
VRRWNATQRKQVIIDELEERGVSLRNLAAEVGKDFDPFDLILHVAYDQRPLKRHLKGPSKPSKLGFEGFEGACTSALAT